MNVLEKIFDLVKVGLRSCFHIYHVNLVLFAGPAVNDQRHPDTVGLGLSETFDPDRRTYHIALWIDLEIEGF